MNYMEIFRFRLEHPDMSFAFVILIFMSSSEFGESIKKAPRNYRNGDLLIGALLPITRSPDCRTVNEGSLQLVESIIYGIEILNSRRDLLTNTSLGYDIRDTCSMPQLALKETLDLISGGKDKFSCVNGKDRDMDCKATRLIAILGPASLEGLLVSAGVFSFNRLPQIAFTPITRLLSNIALYNTLFSVTPSISDEMSAIVEVIGAFQWSCVNLIGSDDMYGHEATTILKRDLKAKNICVATDELIRTSHPERSYLDTRNAIKLIRSKAQVTVTVLLAGQDITKNVFREARRQNFTAHVWLGNEAQVGEEFLAKEYSDVIGGMIALSPPQSDVETFKEYLKKSLSGLSYCDWLRTLKGINTSCGVVTPLNSFNTSQVIEPESLSYRKHTYIMNAILVVAHSVNRILKCTGNRSKRSCRMGNVTSARVTQEMKSLAFTDVMGENVEFHGNELNIKKLSVSNLHDDFPHQAEFVPVGSWVKTGKSETLRVNRGAIQWAGDHIHTKPFSGCAIQCAPGTYVEYGPLSCLWECMPCPEGTFSANYSSLSCTICHEDKMPNEEKTECLEKKYEFLKHFDILAIFILFGSAIGEILTVGVLVIFLKYLNTPVVKASNMGFSLFTLVLLLVWFLVPILFIGRPNDWTCKARTVLIPMLYTSVSAFLLTKTKRLIRIFSALDKNRFLSNYWYSFVACAFVVVQVIFCAVYLVRFPPEEGQIFVLHQAIVLHCTRNVSLEVASFTYNCILAVSCATFAFKSRNLPETYSEAKHICFTMISFMASWIIYFAGYYGTTYGNLKAAVPSLGITLGAYAVLFFIFLPKIRVIFFRPEKNTKKAVMEGARKYSIDVACGIDMTYFQAGARERRHTLAALPTYQKADSALRVAQLNHTTNSLGSRTPGSCLVGSIKETEEESENTHRRDRESVSTINGDINEIKRKTNTVVRGSDSKLSL